MGNYIIVFDCISWMDEGWLFYLIVQFLFCEWVLHYDQ